LIRAALRLLILYSSVWLLSTQWNGLNTVFTQVVSAISDMGPVQNPHWIMAAFGLTALLWHLLGLGLWMYYVPLAPRIGPVRHPFPDKPLRVHLHFKPSRFLGLIFLTMLWQGLGLRALTALVPSQSSQFPFWAEWLAQANSWLVYGALHLAAVVFGWSCLWLLLRLEFQRTGKPFGFVAYQLRRRPVVRVLTRVVLCAHLPVTAFAAHSHPHYLHLGVTITSLVAIVLTALLAQYLVLIIERRHDYWLTRVARRAAAELHEEAVATPALDCWTRTLHFLHPELESLPRPEAASPAGKLPASAVARRSEPAQSLEAAVAAEVAGQHTLEQAIQSLELGDANRARRLLEDAVLLGDRVVQERAEALLKTLPGTRFRLIVVGTIVAVPFSLLLVAVGWTWFSLPSGPETRRLARSAHIHVRKQPGRQGPVLNLLGNRYDYSLNTRLSNVSKHFINAVIASEDHRYFEHGVAYKVAKFAQAGVLCVIRKMDPLAKARPCRGNSTLPQQLARNLFLSEQRSIRRKFTELLWAIKMETHLSKAEVLELYMNRIYLGKGNFGVEMAARDYFQKSAADLSLREAAYLAAAIKRPNWNWRQDRKSALARARLILTLMQRHGVADRTIEIGPGFQPTPGTRTLHRPYLGHLWQWVRADVANAMRDLPNGDYKVLTSLDAEVEVYAERHLSRRIAMLRAQGTPVSQGAMVVMRINGEVLAMVGGIGNNVKARGFNRAKRTQGLHARPPASSFKPFVYLAALESGLRPTSLIDARPVSINIPGSSKAYEPRNHDGETYGWISMREGLVRSINTAAVNLLHGRLGFDVLFDTAGRLGIDTTEFKRQWGLALGQSAVPLIEMIGAYAVFASDGRSVQPHAVLAITTSDGRTVWRRRSPSGQRVFRSSHIGELNSMLREVVSDGTGHRAGYQVPDNVTVAGKTGTGDDFVDAWFIGFTEDLVIGVWMGNDQPVPMPGLYGGTGPARVFNAVLRDLITYTNLVDPTPD